MFAGVREVERFFVCVFESRGRIGCSFNFTSFKSYAPEVLLEAFCSDLENIIVFHVLLVLLEKTLGKVYVYIIVDFN